MTPQERQALLHLTRGAVGSRLDVRLPQDAGLLAMCEALERERIFRRVINEPDHVCFERTSGAPLLELMLKHQTDKALHRFDLPYGTFLDARRHDITSVLELGVKKGASMRVWEEYFPQARIFGVDQEPTRFMREASGRMRCFVGGQTDNAILAQVCAEAGSFDLIIDDGSHMADDQVASLRYLWPFLAPHGVYVIEDTHAHQKFPDVYGNERSRHLPMSEMLAQEVARRLVEDVSAPPGICVYEGIALLLNGEGGILPDFDRYVKR